MPSPDTIAGTSPALVPAHARAMKIPSTGYLRILVPVLLAGIILAMYLPLGSFPYALDDWGMLRALTFTPAGPFILDVFNPVGRLFYRPIPCAYFVGLDALWGLTPAAFHIASVLALILASFLVADTGKRLSGSAVAGWGAGFLFAAAATVHLDTQMWLVGTYEIGALLFGLVSVSLVLRGRYVASAVSFAGALGCKEVAVTLPFILMAVWLAVGRAPAGRRLSGELWSKFRLHLVLFATYGIVKSAGLLPFTLPVSHPYAHTATFGNVLDATRLYAYWSLEALVPLKSAGLAERWMLMVGGLVILASTVGLLLALFRAAVTRALSRDTKVVLALLSWVSLVVMLPVLLGSMLYKYYLLSALPPLAIGIPAVLRMLLPRSGERTVFPVLAIVLVAANTIDGSMHIQRKIRLGQREGMHASSRAGENNLMRRAGVVGLVWKPLMTLAPTVPPHTVFLLPGIDSWTFQNSSGVQTWYRDSTLRVAAPVPGSPVRDGKISLRLFPNDNMIAERDIAVESVDTGRVLVFRLEADSLVRVPFDEYLRSANP
jgi:hypothetical protein